MSYFRSSHVPDSSEYYVHQTELFEHLAAAVSGDELKTNLLLMAEHARTAAARSLGSKTKMR